MRARIVLVVLAALLALPIVQTSSPVEAKPRPRTVTRTFRNPAKIDLPVTNVYVSPALLYPSPMAVRGLKSTIRDVNLRLINVTHNNPQNVPVLLVGPRGQTAIVMAHVGGGFQISDVTLELDDEATAPLPEDLALQSGVYRPTNAGQGSLGFPDPAPPTTANAALSVFDGTNPNGTWRLFVLDLYPSDVGAFAGGWELEITTKVKGKKRR